MSLAAGTKLGPYEILGAAGAGGMGEVYRARDTRLDRTVAVKVLSTRLADRGLAQPFTLQIPHWVAPPFRPVLAKGGVYRAATELPHPCILSSERDIVLGPPVALGVQKALVQPAAEPLQGRNRS